MCWMRPVVILMIMAVPPGCARKEFNNPCDPKNAPPPPRLGSPVDGEITPDNPPLFVWAEVAGAGLYHIEVDDDREFGSAAVSECWSSTCYRPDGCFDSSTYYWRVRTAGEKEVFGGWSPADSFSVRYPLIGTAEVEGSFVYDVQVSGRFAYLVGWPFGLAVVDVSSPFSPSLVSTLELSDSDDARRVLVDGDYTYVGDYDEGIYVVDIRDPTRPREVGRCSLYDLRDISKTGDCLVCAQGLCLRTVDVSDPWYPRLVDRYCRSDECYGVSASGEYVYAVFWREGLQVVHFSDPLRSPPHLVGSCEDFDCARDVFARDNYAFLVDYCSGFHVVDVSDPSSPVVIGHCQTPGGWFVHVDHRYALVGQSHQTVAIVDISQLTSPQVTGRCGPEGYVSGAFAEAGHAYVACGEGGLRILRME